MPLNSIAVQVLLGISQLLGVSSVPDTPNDGWATTRGWQDVGGVDQLEAESTEIPRTCAHDPEGTVEFPQVIHGAHEIFLDGQRISVFGDPTFASVRSFYGVPILKCSDIMSGHKLTWRVSCYSRYFSRFAYFPRFRVEPSRANVFAESLNLMAAGSLAVMSLFSLIIFLGRVKNSLVASIVLANLCPSVYFGLAVPSFFQLPLPMLTAHRLADLGVLTGLVFFFNGLRLSEIIPSLAYRIYLAMVGIGIGIILCSSTGDGIQLGTSLAFGPTLAVSGMGIFGQLRKILADGFDKRSVFGLLSLAIFFGTMTNEIFICTGLAQTYTVANLGCIFDMLFYTFAVNEQINQTYRERDYLRANLQQEVDHKTAELKTALDDLKGTQAELIQSAKLASLGTLSAGIAHEINNSLNYVYGAMKPLEKILLAVDLGDRSAKVSTLVKVMNDGLTLTLGIIKSLRNYTGMNQAKFNDLRLQEAIDSVLTIIRSKIEGHTVVCDIAPGLEIFGSVVGLNQIFMNLIGNAADAMKDAGTLTIRATEQAGMVVVTITDTGTGMPRQVLDRIFEPFFTTKGVGKGTGLGLHIVKMEVDRHGGRVSVASEEGKGTTFTLELPKGHAVTAGVAA